MKSMTKTQRILSCAALLSVSLNSVSALAVTSGPQPHKRTDTPNLKRATIGKYLYVGNVPRFASNNLEIYVSKIGLTVRVKGWVTQQMQREYGNFLLQRWLRIHDAFQDSSLKFERLRSADQVAATTSDRGVKGWLMIAKQYMKHNLEDQGVDIYAQSGDSEQYEQNILTAILRNYLDDSTLTIKQGLELARSARSGQGVSAEQSERLFIKHLGENFTRDSSRSNALGYLTFVYPIAASTKGPFDQPPEGVQAMGLAGSVNARWWSDKYKDLYGGFPFLLLDDTGVAFHGPITSKTEVDTWYLRRGYVSAACHRMDSSDMMEFQALLPSDFRNLAHSGRGVRAYIMDWPDVSDVDGDGKPEALDVAFYELPGSVKVGQSIEQSIAPWMMPQAQQRFWSSQYSQFDKILPNGNRFDVKEGKFYGIPKYELTQSSVRKNGYYDAVPIKTFPHRGNRIIQYREAGQTYQQGTHDDDGGKFNPQYFNSH